MEYLSIGLRMGLLAFSFYGYIQFLKNKVLPELSIGWLFASIGSILFIAGLLNILKEAAWTIFILGLFLAVKCFVAKNKLKTILQPGILFFLITAVFFLFLLYGSKFETSDNFSHWAKATKVLMETDMFPNTNNVYKYYYPSYPIGSACFIYYFAEIIGIQSEWLQMWAQAILMVGMISGLFAFAKHSRSIFTAVISSLMLLCGETAFVDLMVDTLLPIVAIGAFCFCVYYRETLASKLFMILPYTIFLISIKQSGLIFVLFVGLYTLSFTKRNSMCFKHWISLILLTFLIFYLWSKHVDMAFSVDISSHNMSVANYGTVLRSKSTNEIIQIVQEFASRIISDIIILLMLFAGATIILFSVKNQRHENMPEIKKIIFFLFAFYTIYQIGMLAMYLVSMPKAEAMYLASYTRYHQTILIFCTGLLTIALLLSDETSIQHTHNYQKGVILTILTLVIVFFALKPNLNYYKRQNEAESLNLQDRARAESLVNDYSIPDHGKCLLIVKDNRVFQFLPYPIKYVQHFYLNYLMGYMLDSADIDCIGVSEINSADYNQYEYVILFDETKEGRDYFITEFDEIEKDVVSLN